MAGWMSSVAAIMAEKTGMSTPSSTGTGTAPFERRWELLYTHSASGSIAADFNEDGYVDLAVANHKVDGDHLGFSSVWWNGPDGFNRKNRVDLPTAGPHGMTSAEPGNALTRGAEEFYESEILQAEIDVHPHKAKSRRRCQPKPG